jgi:acetyltransferase
MSIRNLAALFNPGTIALVGATPRPGSAGSLILRNLEEAGFPGSLFLVNPHHVRIGERTVYPDIAHLPAVADLAILAIPPSGAANAVAELGARGTRAAIIVVHGFTAAERQALLDAAKPHLLRLLGPDSVGVAVPARGLNAGLGHIAAAAGGLAFVTQSGAMASAILDWAEPRRVGFSHLIALGEMVDVDFGDLLDYLGDDPATRAILLYVEHLTAARKFMSAARAAARRKPVLVVKVGGRRAAVPHATTPLAALAMPDQVHDAAFRRAGMLRVRDMASLFDAAETLSSTGRQTGDRLAILANGGGPGDLAADMLEERGGRLALLSASTRARLTEILPAWGRSDNPIDLGGDADAERYRATLEILLGEPEIDAILAINCPTALHAPVDAARAVIALAQQARPEHAGRNLLVNWLGDHAAQPARALFAAAGIAVYDTPDSAIRGFMNRVNYHRNQSLLLETVPSRPHGLEIDREAGAAIVATALRRGPGALAPEDLAALLAVYGIPFAPDRPTSPVALQLLAGMVDDPLFGPVILFGHGGDAARALDDTTLEFPPLNLALARAQIARTRVRRLIDGSDGRPDIAIDALADILIRLGQLVADLAEIRYAEINPIVAEGSGAVALGARIDIAPATQPGAARLAIRPYPVELASDIRLRDGTPIHLRPIRPEDEPAIVALVQRMTPEDRRLRFFVPLRELTHQFAAKLTQIDYEREMALVALPADSGEILGVARFIADPDNVAAEFAVAVRSDLKGRGLGWMLMRRLIEVAKARGIGELVGTVLNENEAMLTLCRALGFSLRHNPREVGIVIASMPLRD